MPGKTYSGWTAEQIEEAEMNGDYIPPGVYTDFVNGDSDQDWEDERFWEDE